MTLPDLITLVRQAPADELPEVIAELAAATAMAEKRMLFAPRPKEQAPPADEPEMTVDEAAAILRRSPKSVYAMCTRMRDPLPSRQYGRTRRVPRGPFNEWRMRQGSVTQ